MRYIGLLLLAGCASAPCPATPTSNGGASSNGPPTSTSTSNGASTGTVTATPAATPVERTRDRLLDAMRAKDAKAIDAMLSANMRAALPLDKLVTFVEGVGTAKGALGTATLEPNSPVSPRKGTYRIKAERGEWQLELTVGDDGTILGMKVAAPPAPDPEVRRANLPLTLPFKGEWTVVWGGPTEDVNQHVRHKSQRRAADLIVTDADGKSFKGTGKDNADYYAYGKDVLAAADGKVHTVVDGLPDSVPGVLNGYSAIGNAVVIEHASPAGAGGEPVVYSMSAHLKPGSIKVKPGATVKRGQVLGQCGNSGNSSEPHLHFQLMDGPRVESSFGVEAVFPSVDVVREGKREPAKGYTFLKGDRVRAIDAAAVPR